jgi:hypothetical protein
VVREDIGKLRVEQQGAAGSPEKIGERKGVVQKQENWPEDIQNRTRERGSAHSGA